jgi:hypothetical protein
LCVLAFLTEKYNNKNIKENEKNISASQQEKGSQAWLP